MKDYKPKDIRNFAVVGHASSGKTMLTEAMLACGGEINRIGSIEAGSTASDYHVSEKDHQISVHASLLHTEWLERKFNIIDTPGYMDFISEGLGAIRVGDFALVVVSATQGVGVGTDQVWNYATHYGIPKMLVINGLDKEHTEFDQSLETCRAHFGKQVFPLTLPIDAGPGFHKILDVPRSEVITFKTDGSGKYTEEPATGELLEQVKVLHGELIELVAESDDSLLEKFFDQGSLTEEEMRDGIHAAVQNRSLIPLFATSALTNVGTSRLMDFIAKYGSSPVDRATVEAHDESGEEVRVELTGSEPVIYIFKTLSEAHVGEMSFFRVYSGSVKPGLDLYNSGRKVNERLGQIFTLNGKNRESVDQVNAGDIGAVVKLRDTHTGNTLCSPKHIIELPEVAYPKPNIHAALKLKAKGDEEKLAVGLSTLHEEDPTFHYLVDSELHQTVVSGQGELHLQIIVERLKRRFNVEVELTEPRVPYRETINGKSEAKYRHKKQSGGAGQFGEVWMRIETAPRDSGVDFKQTLVGTNVDRVFVPSVEKGVQAACTEGILAGYRVTDVKIDFYDGKMHPVDSKDIAFQIAGYQAFKEAFMKANPRMLEPICSITVKVPDSHMGDVMGDISSRRGRILGMDTEGQYQVIKALVPQKELYHYSTTLRSLTGGRGMHSEEFDHYEEVPREFEQKIIAAAKAAKEEE
jgi:elongation factor G